MAAFAPSVGRAPRHGRAGRDLGRSGAERRIGFARPIAPRAAGRPPLAIGADAQRTEAWPSRRTRAARQAPFDDMLAAFLDTADRNDVEDSVSRLGQSKAGLQRLAIRCRHGFE